MTDDNPLTPRQEIGRAIMASATEANDLGDHMLLGFAVVAEWTRADGQRCLTFVCGDGNGDALPDWTAQGYLTNVLAGDLPDWVHGGDADDDSDTDAL